MSARLSHGRTAHAPNGRDLAALVEADPEEIFQWDGSVHEKFHNRGVEKGEAKTVCVKISAFFPAERFRDAWALAHRPVEEIVAVLDGFE